MRIYTVKILFLDFFDFTDFVEKIEQIDKVHLGKRLASGMSLSHRRRD